MIKIFILALVLLSGCTQENPKKTLNGKKLLEFKCASCHDINMPPIISEDEPAPPMMAISFHVHRFMKPSDESQRTSKAIAFVADYVLDPSLEKAFCDEKSLKKYGLMPSQKSNVTEDEAKAIASYMFKHFTQEKLAKIQKQKEIYDALPQGEKLALKHKCLQCHKPNMKTVGPSFIQIALKYEKSDKGLIQSIKNGSRGKWNTHNGPIMPAFKELSDKELEVLSDWIREIKVK